MASHCGVCLSRYACGSRTEWIQAGWPILSLFLHCRLPHPSRGLCGRVGFSLSSTPPLPFPLPRGPLRFDFHGSLGSSGVVSEAAPLPVLGASNQLSPHRIAMNVSQFLNPLRLGPDGRVVISNLPESLRLPHPSRVFCGRVGLRPQLSRSDLLQHLNHERKFCPLRFADEQVHMLGHDYISGNEAAMPPADTFQLTRKSIFSRGRVKQLHPPITAECDEVQLL
jgi:hypothetical protein